MSYVDSVFIRMEDDNSNWNYFTLILLINVFPIMYNCKLSKRNILKIKNIIQYVTQLKIIEEEEQHSH